MKIHIGLDDCDSPQGLCTTYIGAVLASRLKRLNVKFSDYPYLVRLNPNVPFKTRGNGAVSLHVECDDSRLSEVLEVVSEVLALYEKLFIHGKRDPSVVVLTGDVPLELRLLYLRALHELLPSRYVMRILESLEDKVVLIKTGKGRGLIGAAAAIGAYGFRPYTFELLIYRSVEERSRDRGVSYSLVLQLDRMFRSSTFANIDPASRRILAVPHGPDPVVLGIRSIDSNCLKKVRDFLLRRMCSKRWIVYKSNQGTGAHLHVRKYIHMLRPYDSVRVLGKLTLRDILRGGHVRLIIEDSTGRLTCMVYRETGHLNRVARIIPLNSHLEVYGGVKPGDSGLVLNVEAIRVVKPAREVEHENPLCPLCGRRMKSAGRGKGFKCKKCGYYERYMEKKTVEKPPLVEPGLYLQDPIAYRHLSVPKRFIGIISLPPKLSFAQTHPIDPEEVVFP